MTSPDPVPLGAYRGFGMVMRFDSISREYRVTLSNKMSYTVSLGTDLYGNIARLDNALAGIEAQRDAAREELENAKQQFATARAGRAPVPTGGRVEGKIRTARRAEHRPQPG